MLKRLSYPLAWVEGLTGENNKSSDSAESTPNTGDSNQSVFSKVFSRYVRWLSFGRCDSGISGYGMGSYFENLFDNNELVNFYCNLEWTSRTRSFCIAFPKLHMLTNLFELQI